jgi:hypothetical protein
MSERSPPFRWPGFKRNRRLNRVQAARLADYVRDAGWTHEEYLAAVLDREVAARHASGAQLRIRAAGFGACKTLEEFDWDAHLTLGSAVARSRQAAGMLGRRSAGRTDCRWR